jgi:hypothetical protein
MFIQGVDVSNMVWWHNILFSDQVLGLFIFEDIKTPCKPPLWYIDSYQSHADVDTASFDTIMPSIQQGPMTRARARQFNYQEHGTCRRGEKQTQQPRMSASSTFGDEGRSHANGVIPPVLSQADNNTTPVCFDHNSSLRKVVEALEYSLESSWNVFSDGSNLTSRLDRSCEKFTKEHSDLKVEHSSTSRPFWALHSKHTMGRVS